MRRLWSLARRTGQAYAADNASFLAAAISYYVLFSVVPLALFAVSVFGLVVRDEQRQEDVADEIVDYLNVQSGDVTVGPNAEAIEERYGAQAVAEVRRELAGLADEQTEELATRLDAGETVTLAGLGLGSDELLVRKQNLVIDTVRGVSRVSGALAPVGLLATAWSASAMFAAVRRSLDIIWGSDAKRPLVRQKLIDLALVFGLGVLIAASVVATAAIHSLRRLSDDALGPFSAGLSVLPLLPPAMLSFLVFLMAYRYVPAGQRSVRDVLPGALLATVLFEVLKNGFSLYISNFGNFDVAYGTLGGALLFLLWTYFSSSILLLGAELSLADVALRREEHDPAPSPPGAPAGHALLRFVRGLFFRESDGRPTVRSSRDPD